MKDFENDHGTVFHFAANFVFEIARLRGGDFVIDENTRNIVFVCGLRNRCFVRL